MIRIYRWTISDISYNLYSAAISFHLGAMMSYLTMALTYSTQLFGSSVTRIFADTYKETQMTRKEFVNRD